MIPLILKRFFVSGLLHRLEFKPSMRMAFLKGFKVVHKKNVDILEQPKQLELDLFLKDLETSPYKRKKSSSFYKIGIYKVYHLKN